MCGDAVWAAALAVTLPQRVIATVPGSQHRMPDPAAILPTVLLAVVPSLICLVVLNAIDRYEKEPWTIVLACVGVGAVVAPVIALGALLFVLVRSVRDEFDDILDGVTNGAAVGARDQGARRDQHGPLIAS